MLRRLVVGTAILVLALIPGTAHAEVRVSSGPLVSGSPGFLSLAVSTERTDATTTRVEVRLPAEGTFDSVTAEAKPGWTSALVREGTGSVRGVLWTAEPASAGISAGTFEVFTVGLGAVPAGVDRLAFSATQTYGDGQTVAADGLSVAVEGERTAVPAAGAPPQVEQVAAVAAVEEEDNAARVAIGLTAGGAAILLAFLATSISRRNRPAPAG
ncbi:MAG: DUF1775 domain-containing protein [Sporichthyaceae bacterium]